MISVKLTPRSKQVMIDIGDILPKTRAKIEQAFYDIGDDVVKEVRKLIKSRAKTGRVYTIRGSRHQASAEGQAPANLSGKLARSSNYKVRNWQEMSIGESASYASFLELGTKRIRKRPHLIAAINNVAGKTYRTLEDAVRI